jgi:hypothetical protein
VIQKTLKTIAAALLVISFSFSAFAFEEVESHGRGYRGRGDLQSQSEVSTAGDSQIVAANQGRKQVFFVQGSELETIKILPDDTKGLPHQKWIARCSDGSTVLIVYNSDMGQRVPIQIGDRFSVGGQYIWTPGGGLIHWTHYDPKNQRPDGFVNLNGVQYGVR